jgi:hypothetical protein
MNTAVRRAPDGKLLKGSILNAGGRPIANITAIREILAQHSDELVDRLLQLTCSKDEAIRLAALREAFDRLLGRPQLMPENSSGDTIITSIQSLYLAAVKDANTRPDPRIANPIDVTPAPPPDAPNSTTTEW